MACQYENINDLIKCYETLFKQYSELVKSYGDVFVRENGKNYNDQKEKLKLIRENLSDLEGKLNEIIESISPGYLDTLEEIIKNLRSKMSQDYDSILVQIGEYGAKEEFYHTFLVKLYFAKDYF